MTDNVLSTTGLLNVITSSAKEKSKTKLINVGWRVLGCTTVACKAFADVIESTGMLYTLLMKVAVNVMNVLAAVEFRYLK